MRILPWHRAVLVAITILGSPALSADKPRTAVPFDIKVVAGGTRWGPPSTTWLATYAKGGKVAKFRITLEHKALGRGEFSREPGSDTSVLLEDLAEVLRGRVGESAEKVEKLSVRFYVLGSKLTRTAKDGFRPKPPGDWLLVKIFVGKEDAEFLLAVNEKTGKAEIRMKDPDYADRVMRELGQVF